MPDATDQLAAVMAETNRLLDKVDRNLASLGADVAAAMNAAARSGHRVRRARRNPYCHQIGNAAGRNRSEVVAILNRFGHTLPA